MKTDTSAAGIDDRYHIAAGETAAFDVSGSREEMEASRDFLLGATGPGVDGVRMGKFGQLAVRLARCADQWSIRISLSAADADEPSGNCPIFSVNVSRADLLKAIEASLSGRLPPEVRDVLPALVQADRSAVRNRHDLHSAADVAPLVAQLLTRWVVPRIGVLIESLPEDVRQRSQTRINHLVGASEVQYAGPVAASVVLLVGAARIASTYVQATNIMGSPAQPWGRIGLLLLATALAWLAGAALGAIWCRLRLILTLLRLRRRVRLMERVA